VTSFDQQDLGERVDYALTVVTPGFAPVAAIVARGRGIRRRRRAAWAGALAVAAVLVVATPGLLRTGEPPSPSAPALTISNPDPNARGGVIGAGTLDGKPWTVRLAGRSNPVARAPGLPATGRLGTGPDGSAPATFHTAGSAAWRLLAGPVRPDVAYLTMRLADGTLFTLHPATWHGHDYIGLVVPWNLAVARFTAYSRHRQLAYAIPFPVSDNFPEVVSWLRPGTVVPAVSSAAVAHGGDGHLYPVWSVAVKTGPWGACLVVNAGYLGHSCRPTTAYPPGAVTAVISVPQLGVVAGITGPAVASIQLRLRNGNTVRLHVVYAAGQGFYALSVRNHPVASWTAYTATGQAVARGTGTPG
jgi:hypothetical protein